MKAGGAERAASTRGAGERIPAWVFIALGGAFGALARGGLDALAAAHPWSLPLPGFLPLMWSTVVVDLVGAFFLGALSAILARRATPTRGRVNLRFFAATGFAGAFTTYGTLIAATRSGMSAAPAIEGILAAAAGSLLLLVIGVACAGAGWLLLRALLQGGEGDGGEGDGDEGGGR